ncbi:MAG: 2-isopropylmalate synthase [Calditrichae bacterium]|nr:2-isopropylmalate synthase [Calditrichia bacterium]
MPLKILDSTLREGEQTPGVCFNNHIKTAIADLLDEVGVDIIETGHPVVTEEIHESVREIAGRGLRAKVGAHARSVQNDVDVALECGVGFLGIFYCVSDSRLNHHEKKLSDVVEKITSIVSYARETQPNLIIRYTPEDTVRSEWHNVITAATEAVHAGANVISVADTTGFMIPGTDRSMYDYVARLKDKLAVNNCYPMIAVHCHNDRGLALANALDGYRAGAEIIDATVMGLGERAGLVDLATLLAVLKTDFNLENNWNLKLIPELYKLVSRFAGFEIPKLAPVTGQNAFTHCAGVHTQAALKNPLHYQSLDPALVGRESQLSLDHMSGLSAVKYALDKIGVNGLSETAIANILDKVKEIGQMGRVVDLDELKHIVNYLTKERNNNIEQQSQDWAFAFVDQTR